MKTAFLSGEEHDWTTAPAIDLIGTDGNTGVVARVGIWKNHERHLRLDIHASAGYSPFKDARCVSNLVCVGYGQYLFVVKPEPPSVHALLLDGYFGHLYAPEDLEAPPQSFGLLVASASELISLSSTGAVSWHARSLGVDGVLVNKVQGGQIYGSGEWDPPGGWSPFKLHLYTGEAGDA